MPDVHDDVDSTPEAADAAEQMAFDPLPGMVDLDALQVDLDEIDRVLADLDDERPARLVHEVEAPHLA